jgi:hypothetical protein
MVENITHMENLLSPRHTSGIYTLYRPIGILHRHVLNSISVRSGYYLQKPLTLRTLCFLPTDCNCLFRMALTINSDCFPKQR